MQPTLTLSVISFFNTLKYPPSLDYLLMTLGPALIALASFDGVKAERELGRVLLVFGRVPMFYYVLHIYLIHIMAIVVGPIDPPTIRISLELGFYSSTTSGWRWPRLILYLSHVDLRSSDPAFPLPTVYGVQKATPRMALA